MKRFFLAFLLISSWSRASEFSLNLSVVPLTEVIRIYYSEVSNTPYVICPEVVADVRSVSIRANNVKNDFRSIEALLRVSGYEVSKEDGVEVICKSKLTDTHQKLDVFVYKPKYRNAAYLMSFASPLVEGKFSNNSKTSNPTRVGEAPNTGGAIFPENNDDLLIFEGEENQMKKLQKIIEAVDTRPHEVIIKTQIYEVSSTKTNESALALIGSLLGSKLTFGLGSASAVSNTLKIQSGGLSLVAGALESNDSFRLLSSPFIRTKSGSSASLTVGQDVPVLDSIVIQNGQSQQSVKYHSSGMIFTVSPVVRDNFIEIDVSQVISDFQKTTTGLTTSPTLNKREIKTSVVLNPGEVLVLGGLRIEKKQGNKSFFLFFPISDRVDEDHSEIIMLLEVDKG